ncbi:MAG: hypothetical protein GY788_19335 [bacterium]|nr:hypothetical protein [bacterium]
MTTITTENPKQEATPNRLVRPFGITAAALFTSFVGSRSHSHRVHHGKTTCGAAPSQANRPQVYGWPAQQQQLR